ncbi:serine-rich adhesin for platelets isoform X1 [Drosophila nasuta]|uniref:serine-rich adhesin for platelets isoform X1 n=1 Tax=Drosophila nasuta TaxID=42062 RepID=UPI00295F5615|nr:serine-rich adhesin for platelets isoform X1 [Drosophila nasuta]
MMSLPCDTIDAGSDSQMSSNDSTSFEDNRLNFTSESDSTKSDASCARTRGRSKRKRTKSKMRSNSKDMALAGFTGSYPKMVITNSNESNSDADGDPQLPADLKAICATGLSVFPREELQSQPPSESESPQTLGRQRRWRRRNSSSSSSCSASSTSSSNLVNKTLANSTSPAAATTTTMSTIAAGADTTAATTTTISSTNTLNSTIESPKPTNDNNSVDNKDDHNDNSSFSNVVDSLAEEQHQEPPATSFELKPQPETPSHPPEPEPEPQSESSEPQTELPNKKRKKYANDAAGEVSLLHPQLPTQEETLNGSLTNNDSTSRKRSFNGQVNENMRMRSKSMYYSNNDIDIELRKARARSVGPVNEENVALLKTKDNSLSTPTDVANDTGNSIVRRRSIAANKLPSTDNYYKLPFKYGWKRELVMRSGNSSQSASRQRADVVFISPAGKKMRSRDDIIPLLSGELTIDHFCFQRALQNAGEEFETMRTAQPAVEHRKSMAAAKQLREEQQQQLKSQPKQSQSQSHPKTPAVVKEVPQTPPAELVSGKRIPKPKAPKGASPPPQGWTPTMAVKGNARVLAASNSNDGGGTGSPGSHTARKRSSNQHTKPKQSKAAESKTQMFHQQGGVLPPKQLVDNTMVCAVCMSSIKDKKQAFAMGASNGKTDKYVCTSCIRPGSSPAHANKKEKDKEKEKEKEPIDENVNANNLSTNDLSYQNSFSYQEALMELSGNSSSSLAEIAEITTPCALPPEQLFNDSPMKVTPKPQEIVVINGRKAVAVYGPPQRAQLKVIGRESNLVNLEKFYGTHFSNGKNNIESIVQSVSLGNINCQVLLAVMKTLDFHDRVRMSKVCNTWAMIGRDRNVWRTVKLRDTHVNNWTLCLRDMVRYRTRELDMMGVKMDNPKLRMEGDLRSLKSLRVLRTDATDTEFIQLILRRLSRLVELRATCTSRSLNLSHVDKMSELRVLRIRMTEPKASIVSLAPMQSLTKLRELSLRGVNNMSQLDLLHLKGLRQLETLLLGSCRGMKTRTFGEEVLPNLKRLRHLRVENNGNRSFIINEIMGGLAAGGTVQRLELINVNVDKDFSSQLTNCKSVKELLLMPNFIQNTAYMVHYIMQAINDNSEQLMVFRLGLSFELLSATRALAMNPEKDCIPVVLPIPGVPVNDKLNNSAEPIAYLPVDRLESILHHMMPQAWLTVAKVPQSEITNLKFLSAPVNVI